jgi:hypothetical protein
MDNIDRYEILDEPDGRGHVTVKRLADGRLAPCKAAWLKAAPHSESPTRVMPRSRAKALRMAMLDWVTRTEGLTNGKAR